MDDTTTLRTTLQARLDALRAEAAAVEQHMASLPADLLDRAMGEIKRLWGML